jgi:hypothetical protein
VKRIIYAVLAIAVVAGIIVASNGNEKESAVLTEQKPDTTTAQQTEEQKKKEEEAKLAAENFIYTAQSGDSYSLMARKAVQSYLAETKTTLTNAQIIFAETNLTQLAKSPFLEVNQKVTIAKDTLKEWSEKARSLTKDQESLWNVYAQYANFDTSAVGVAK